MRQLTIFRNWRTKRRSQSQPVVQIKIRDGQFHILGNGVWHSYWREPYHLLLTIPWTGFLALTVLCYVVTNAVFALLYLAQPASIANAKPGSFLDAFFFSVQTLASIGYGALYPQTVYANILVTIEAMVSLVGIALLTGLAFARFSRPTARVSFSHVAVIGPYEGVPTFIFRAANQRRNQILEAQIRLYLMRDETSAEGHAMRRFYELKLLRSRTPSFTLSWTVLHPIDEYSPFYGATPESLAQMRASVVVSLSGIDETVSQVIHARHTYSAQEILWNYCFVDIFHETADGHRYIDYNHFHDVLPLP
ncbi:ion channel [Trichocoleus desertorum AS-A10]|uniref:ion channel n=1 Tax=Trichocoleus desertorum TaxID=1481672 RepID=UPI0032994CCB